MSIFVCGDTHGNSVDFDKIKQFNQRYKKVSKMDDILIQLGDFGLVWYPLGIYKNQEYWLNWISTRKFKMFVVLGNHENYDIIKTFPECEMFGGKVQYLETEGQFGKGIIYFAKRGEIYNIDGKTFWCFGGALSIDKDHRIEGISWWKDELPTYLEYEEGMKNLDKVNWRVDYVLSHTCPVSIIGDVMQKTPIITGKFKDPVAEYLYEIYKKLEFKEWHFGHFHTDIRLDYSNTNDSIFQCHYENTPFKLF